jgi:hypothetical protein
MLLGTLSGAAGVAVVGTVLFGCAGRRDLPWFWCSLGVWTSAALVAPWVMDPTLARERLRPGPGGKDCLFAGAFVRSAVSSSGSTPRASAASSSTGRIPGCSIVSPATPTS